MIAASTRVKIRVGASASETRRLLRKLSPNITRRCSQTTPMRSGNTTRVITMPSPSASKLSASLGTLVPALKK
ncbi:hypothetical protein G6F62_015932 [Rhizopus arrhizus]|nr:hypothetical protein G6F62_015932 [Rhizopus arrhizus]